MSTLLVSLPPPSGNYSLDVWLQEAADALNNISGVLSITWDQIDFTGSTLADIETTSAADLDSGNLAYARLPSGGGTWANGGDLTLTGGRLLFSPDNTLDIGADAATRPRTVYIGTDAYVGSRVLSGFAAFQAVGGTTAWSMQSSGLISTIRFSPTNSAGASFGMAKSASGTPGTFTILDDGEHIGSFVWYGADDVDLATEAARVRCEVDGTPGVSRMPGRIRFQVAAGLADDDIATAMTLWSGGILSVGAGSLTPITTLGRGLEVVKATGTSTIEPAYVRIRSTNSANNWSIVDAWAELDFFSSDAGGIGPNTRARVGAMFEDTGGTLTSLVVYTSNASALTLQWRFTSAGILQAEGAQTIQTATGQLTVATAAGDGAILLSPNGTGLVRFAKAAVPNADDGVALGSTALKWADLFLASGGVINFGAGEVTLTAAADSLTMAGGDLLFSADNALDIGASGATRPRRVYVGTGLQIGTRPDYTVSNPTTNRSLDVTGATLGQLAQVVGTIIQDFIDREVFQ